MTEGNHWREKYREAVARLAEEDARAAKLQNVLRLLVGRLCLAGLGRDPRLDEELNRVAAAVRNGADATQIEQILAPLSQAIAELDRKHESAPATPAATETELAPAEAAEPGRVPAAPILDRLALFPELHSIVSELRAKNEETLSLQQLQMLLERVVAFASQQRAHVQREKLELENLLLTMTSRIDEITSHFNSEMEERNVARDDTETLNQLVTGEVEHLRSEAEAASDLTMLRMRLKERLERIVEHVQEFRAREEIRVRSYRDRVQRMRERIAALERESRSLQETLREEQRLAMLDALTGIPNRAAYDDRMEQEFKRFKRFRRPVSLLAWDIDRFKAINDAYGHKAGDKVLRVVGQHLAGHVRDTDFVARYGGEEFVMLLVGTTAEEALVVADKIRLEIAQLGFHFHGKPVRVTTSCGTTMFTDEDTPDSVFDRADRALYAAKKAGRNCCVIG